MEASGSSEHLFLTRATRRNIPEDGIYYSSNSYVIKDYGGYVLAFWLRFHVACRNVAAMIAEVDNDVDQFTLFSPIFITLDILNYDFA
jgi:hypothetical protein